MNQNYFFQTNNPSFVVTKANVLKLLQKKLKKSKIEKIIDFTILEWKENKKNIVNLVSDNLKNKKIIVRSSAIGEDSIEKSEAGNYQSFLDIDANSGSKIVNAVDKVIESYKKKGRLDIKNQILIQKQTKNIRLSGVIITRSGKNGSPYYTINYDEGGSTTGVTSGRIGKTIKIFSGTRLKIDKHWKILLESVKEIESVLGTNYLDIEFAITKNWKVVIFQVRPLTSIQPHNIPKLENLIKNRILTCKKKVKDLKKRLITNQDTAIFSDMCDWNPAEIIGNSPNLLDYSLYDFLIMNDSWRLGRKNIGYYSPTKQKLMIKFGNKPYVNVKSSFHSLIPKNVNEKLRKKLMKYYLEKLLQKPHLHDKVEFEILFSCYDFTLDKRLIELKKYGFSNSEIQTIKFSLIDFTNSIINKFPEIYKQSQSSIYAMTEKRKLIKKDLKTVKNNYFRMFQASESLLQDCHKYGAIPFSTMARIAFIGTILLKSLLKEKKISQIFYDNFMSSIQTTVTKFQTDLQLYHEKKLSKKKFLEKYGHLRPGTYDITALRYDQNEGFFNKIHSVNPIISKPHHKKFKINDLKENPLNFKTIEFLEFVKKSLIQREELKFQFTHNLSDALEYIVLACEELGLSREEIVNLDIKTIFSLYKKCKKSELKKILKKQNIMNKKKKILNDFLVLPPIIFSERDFEFIQYYISKPNYITSRAVSAKTINLEEKNESPNLTDKIVLIENAHPGYDWIFTKNPAGLITKYGGVASHMAIRCGEIGLPAAIGCGEVVYDYLLNSSNLLLDCKNHQIMILENKAIDQFTEERKLLKSLGYIK